MATVIVVTFQVSLTLELELKKNFVIFIYRYLKL